MKKKNEFSVQFEQAERVERPTPIPLLPNERPGKPFPVAALGPILAGAVDAIVDMVQCPTAIAAQSVIAAASLAAQPHVNVEHPATGKPCPVSLFLVTVAASGERKSAADQIALDPVRLHEAALIERSEKEHREYLDHSRAYERARDRVLGKFVGDLEKLKREIAALGPVPQAPLGPMMIAQDPSIEGLHISMRTGQPSMGLFSAEGGLFIGGHGMSDDNRLKTAAGLSNFWDGTPVSRVRAGDGVTYLRGKRLSLHLMVQPGIADGLLRNPVLRSQGLLSRMLVAAPASTAGTRLQKPIKKSTEGALKRYRDRMLQLLRKKPPGNSSKNELEPLSLPLCDSAKKQWVKFADEIERELGPGARLESVRSFANKLAEHALRIAAVLQLIDNPNSREIGLKVFERALTLARFYLDEALRQYEQGQISEELMDADRMLRHLHASGKQTIGMGQICQSGPGPFRKVKIARRVMATVAEYGWVVLIPGGAKIEGKRHREAWEIIKV